MALRPKLARSEVRGPNAQGHACQRPARLPVGRCKLHGGASTGPRTKDGLRDSQRLEPSMASSPKRSAQKRGALLSKDARCGRTEGAGGLVRGPRSFEQELAGLVQIRGKVSRLSHFENTTETVNKLIKTITNS